MAIILQTKIDFVEPLAPLGCYSRAAMFSGYAIFGAGVTCGFANLVCGSVQLAGAPLWGRQGGRAPGRGTTAGARQPPAQPHLA